MARWRCLTVAGAPAWITDHSCSEEEGNIGAWSKHSTRGTGVLAPDSEVRHQNKHHLGICWERGLVLHPREQGRQGWLLLGRPREWRWRGVDAKKRQTSNPSIVRTQCLLLIWVSPVSSSVVLCSLFTEWPISPPQRPSLSLYIQMLPGVRDSSQMLCPPRSLLLALLHFVLMLSNCGAREYSWLRVPWIARRSNRSPKGRS